MTNSQDKINELTRYLRKMRLPVMAEQLIDIYAHPQADSVTPLDMIERMITEEYLTRRQNAIQRHLKQARLSIPEAHVNHIDFTPKRKLNPMVFDQLKTCQFITNHHNIIIQGATGTGKSFIANALCRWVIESGHTAMYTRMVELLADINMADMDGKLDRFFKKIRKVDVLVIDDFLLTSTNEYEQKYLMEIFEVRSRDKALILSSQMSTSEWHKKLGGGAIADAILDRAIAQSYHIFIEGESLRHSSGSDTPI